MPHVYSNVWVLRARGLLRLAQGRSDEAVEELRECGRRATAIDHLNPAVLPWRSQLAHALIDLGETAEARWLAIDELDRAHAFGGAAGDRDRAARRRAGRGRRGGDPAAARGRRRCSTSPRRSSSAPAAHSALGARCAGSGEPRARASRCAWRSTSRTAAAPGAEDAALAELRATGARPRRRLTSGAGALTPSERRIAELAAAGQQNREIAETLFVTTATVEYHLRNAYRKLGIASRTQLVEAWRPRSSAANVNTSR